MIDFQAITEIFLLVSLLSIQNYSKIITLSYQQYVIFNALETLLISLTKI